MANGKLPNEDLARLLGQIQTGRPEVLVGAQMGQDTAILDLGRDYLVLSTDPITGAAEDLGSLAINVSVNDVATSGAEAVACLLTILAPPQTTFEEIEAVMEEASQEAARRQIEIVGGHTEVTDGVNRLIVQATVIGRLQPDKLLDASRIQPGDGIFLSKQIGLEASVILAGEYEDIINQHFPQVDTDRLKAYEKDLSVKKEGQIAAPWVDYMHDITEGGVYGAVYEAMQGIGQGVLIEEDLIPYDENTKKLCQALDIDLYRLISSGSMLMISSQEEELRGAFAQAGIPLTKIGQVIEEGAYVLIDGQREELYPPSRDALYEGLRKLEALNDYSSDS